jgi:NADP-dependent 3-hydroxy acid dehydrogenase YdfG
LVARRGELLKSLQASLSTPSEAFACDVRDAASVREAAEAFMARHGTPDVVIGNAGISHGTLTEAWTWRRSARSWT